MQTIDAYLRKGASLNRRGWPGVEIHFKFKPSSTNSDEENTKNADALFKFCCQKVTAFVSANAWDNPSVSLIQYQEKPGGMQFHDRYVLTNVGAIEFSVGLDAGKPNQVTSAKVKTSQQTNRYWYRFASSTADFRVLNQRKISPGP